jgi:hypothetical protein
MPTLPSLQPDNRWRIAILKPEVGLVAANAEVSAIITTGLVVDLIQGALTPAEVSARLETTTANVLVIISHGFERGILLSRHISVEPIAELRDDGLFDLADLPAATRDKFDLVLLNTCNSDKAARNLQNVMRAGIICTTLAVDDAEAAAFGGRFTRYLAQSNDPEWAYAMARPGNNDSYMYLASVPDFLATHPIIRETPIL